MPPVQILDIRGAKETSSTIPHLRAEILRGLLKPQGHRTLPPETLYDDIGLKMFNEGMSSWTEWYYPMKAEKQILDLHGNEIASLLKTTVNGEAVLIEFGAGSLEKTSKLLLSAAEVFKAEGSEKSFAYYALDLEKRELKQTLEGLQEAIGDITVNKITTSGMWGTYDDGIRVIEKNELNIQPDVPVHIIFLGVTIGNFSKLSDDISFLKSLPLNRQRGDTLLVGIDRAKSAEAIERSYGFAAASEWIMNGLKVTGRALTGNEGLFNRSTWERYAQYNEKLGRYEAGYMSKIDQTISVAEGVQITFSKGEVVLVMFSNKYLDSEIERLLERSGLDTVKYWMDEKAQCYMYLVRRRA